MKVSLIVPVWNGRDLLRELLDSAACQTMPFFETVIADNASSDGAPEWAESRGSRVVRMGVNRGFAAAVNRAVAESRGEFVAIVNSDVQLDPRWLEKLLESPTAAFATGLILRTRDPDQIDGAWDLVSRGGCSWRAGEGRRLGAPFNTRREIRMASFTAILIRTDIFCRVGGLDERFESYLEDVDFFLRGAALGLRGVFAPEAVCYHHGSATWGRWSSDSVRKIARNQFFLAVKHHLPPWPALVGQSLWGLLAIRHGAGWAWLRGKWGALRRAAEFNSSAAPVSRMFVRESERELLRLQAATGWDFYWRLYAVLIGYRDVSR